ncbi:MAG: hypothetical protein R3A79_06115 [Nannocystaceae bacterium]
MQRALRLAPLGLVLSLGACAGDDSGDAGSATATTSATGATGATATTTASTGDASTSATDDSSGSASSSGGEATTTGATTTTGEATTSDETAGTTAESTTEATSSTTGVTTDDPTDGTTTEAMPASDIDVIITADNAYSFAYGTEQSIAKFFGGVEAKTAAEIFSCGVGPEKYTVPAADADDASFLYIIAWDDSSVTNGVLASFRRTDGGQGFGDEVFTGTPGWQACATGLQYDVGTGGPSLDVINEYIGKCNAGDLDPNTSSGGWVDDVGTELGAVALGEDNTTPYDGGPKAGNEFPLVCPEDMPAEARWMWFDWDPGNVVPPQSPFIFPGGLNPYHQFLLFRLAAELVPEPQ